MRFGLAAKLCLLAALLVFGTTVAAGTFFFRGARAVVRGREVAGLRDEVELCRQNLLADLDRAPADLLALAGTPTARSRCREPSRRCASPSGKCRRPPAQPRSHYLELTIVGAGDLREVLRVERTPNGARAATSTSLQSWQGRSDLSLMTGLAPPAVGFSEIRRGIGSPEAPTEGPPLEQLLVTPVAGSDARPAGWAFLRLDFAALAARLNQSPRLIGFLVNARGDYLAHPDPARVLAGPGNSALDAAFARLQEQSVDESGRCQGLGIPGPWRTARRFDAARPVHLRRRRPVLELGPIGTRLRQAREVLHRKYPGLRVGRGDDPPGRLALRAADPDTLRQAIRDLRGLLDGSVAGDDPYRCETFFARLVPARGAPAGSTARAARRRSDPAVVRTGAGRRTRGGRTRHPGRLLEELPAQRSAGGRGRSRDVRIRRIPDRLLAENDGLCRKSRGRVRGRCRAAHPRWPRRDCHLGPGVPPDG